ncbi:MAG: hypothetical protein HYY16_09265, partial [Planctomycetes bacterium]|nr:hypothetical protein [Planctomycetota bacterium]
PETRLEQAAPVPQRRPGLRRAKLRQMRREIRRIVARARAEGVPEEELPVLQSRRRLRASRGQKSYGVRRRRISG